MPITLTRALVALALAVLGVVPGPDDPVCDPEIGIVTDCVQPQLPEETIGREYEGTDPAPAAVPADVAPTFTG